MTTEIKGKLSSKNASVGWQIFHEHVGLVAGVPDATGFDFEAITRRLVACWNACQGIPTESLEENGVASFDSAVELVKQRDELLVIVQRIEAAAELGVSDALEAAEFWRSEIVAAQSAITKINGAA